MRVGSLTAIVAASLATVVVVAYLPVVGFEFVNYDDPIFITDNPHVRDGLTAESVRWALSAQRSLNWHPVTWLSHLLDVQLFGLEPSGHHATSLFLHVIVTWIVWLTVRSLTGSFWRSALVAALFALHPLRVEVVAWVSARNHLLSTGFGIAAIWAWSGFARELVKWRYGMALVLFAISLASKPALVTLPFVLLLLDWWPFDRWDRSLRCGALLVAEKLPFFALSLASSAVAFGVQQPIDPGPLPLRIGNALVAYVQYLGKTVWPTDLAVLYTHPNLHGGTPWPTWLVGLSALGLLAVTWASLRSGAPRYLATGWLWFIGALVPAIGLVQVGVKAMADRYMYFPTIGLLIALVWGGHHAWTSRAWSSAAQRVGIVALCVMLGLLAVASRRQLHTWRDGLALFEQAERVSPTNPVVHNNLGVALANVGRVEEARLRFETALQIWPEYDDARRNLATTGSSGRAAPP